MLIGALYWLTCASVSLFEEINMPIMLVVVFFAVACGFFTIVADESVDGE